MLDEHGTQDQEGEDGRGEEHGRREGGEVLQEVPLELFCTACVLWPVLSVSDLRVTLEGFSENSEGILVFFSNV